jgi:hypothetical protein
VAREDRVQLVHREGLREHRQPLVPRRLEPGQVPAHHRDRDARPRRVRAHLRDELLAAHLRHPQIHEHEIRQPLVLAQPLERLLRALGGHDLDVLRLEVVDQQLEQRPVVLDDHDPAVVRRIHRARNVRTRGVERSPRLERATVSSGSRRSR